MKNKVLILDYGSPYTQLIARSVRELNIFCEIYPFNAPPEDIDSFNAVILSGSTDAISKGNSLSPQIASLLDKVPVLGIAFGAQLLLNHFGGSVESAKPIDGYGKKHLKDNLKKDSFFQNVTDLQVWMREQYHNVTLSDQIEALAHTTDDEIAAFKIKNQNIYGVFFHPEIHQTNDGKRMLENFLIHTGKLDPSWTPALFIEESIRELKETLGNDKVVLGLSGGVDSTVTSVLLNRAIGDNLYCIFVNHGLLRKNEFENVLHQYKDMGLNVKGVDASDRFLTALKGVTDPEQKRKIIGRVFIEVFDDEAHQIEDVKWLGQGTIYPDIIESISVDGKSVAVKSHHNVGGLPDYMKLQIVEPLKMLFKDEVRRVGKALGIHSDLIGRHPFPGPGLGVRILGELTAEKVRILQEADAILIDKLRSWNLYDSVWQAAAILLPINSVGLKGDQRTYERVVALRVIQSIDGMTADVIELPYAFLHEVSNAIINNVEGVNRVVYDISSKPPATIEWE